MIYHFNKQTNKQIWLFSQSETNPNNLETGILEEQRLVSMICHLKEEKKRCFGISEAYFPIHQSSLSNHIFHSYSWREFISSEWSCLPRVQNNPKFQFIITFSFPQHGPFNEGFAIEHWRLPLDPMPNAQQMSGKGKQTLGPVTGCKGSMGAAQG